VDPSRLHHLRGRAPEGVRQGIIGKFLFAEDSLLPRLVDSHHGDVSWTPRLDGTFIWATRPWGLTPVPQWTVLKKERMVARGGLLRQNGEQLGVV